MGFCGIVWPVLAFRPPFAFTHVPAHLGMRSQSPYVSTGWASYNPPVCLPSNTLTLASFPGGEWCFGRWEDITRCFASALHEVLDADQLAKYKQLKKKLNKIKDIQQRIGKPNFVLSPEQQAELAKEGEYQKQFDEINDQADRLQARPRSSAPCACRGNVMEGSVGEAAPAAS